MSWLAEAARSPRGRWGSALAFQIGSTALAAASLAGALPASLAARAWSAAALLTLGATGAALLARRAWTGAPARGLAWAVAVVCILMLWLAFTLAWLLVQWGCASAPWADAGCAVGG